MDSFMSSMNYTDLLSLASVFLNVGTMLQVRESRDKQHD